MIVYLKKPRLSHPQLLAAWPGMGFVASKTVSSLIGMLSAEKFAFVHPDDYFSPAGVTVEESLAKIPPLPESDFYFWKSPSSGSDLILYLGETQPALGLQTRMAGEVIGLARQMGVSRLLTFAAAPTAIQHQDRPGVWGVATTRELRDYLIEHGIRMLKMGQISGLNGLLLGVAAQENLPALCLLGEIPYYTVNLENPRAVMAILKILEKLLFISLDLSPLKEEIKSFDREINRMGKKAQEAMASFMQQDGEEYVDSEEEEDGEEEGEEGSEGAPPPLTDSARRRIEDLFRIVKRDPSQAPLLKAELDRWGVYPQHEDRFLNLFREGGGRKDN